MCAVLWEPGGPGKLKGEPCGFAEKTPAAEIFALLTDAQDDLPFRTKLNAHHLL